MKSKRAKTADGFPVEVGVRYFDVSDLHWGMSVLFYDKGNKFPYRLMRSGRKYTFDSHSILNRISSQHLFLKLDAALLCLKKRAGEFLDKDKAEVFRAVDWYAGHRRDYEESFAKLNMLAKKKQ